MTRYGIVFLFLGSISWHQAANSQSAPAVQKTVALTASVDAANSDQTQRAKTSKVGSNATVITIDGLCDDAPADKTAASNCKTVITRAQFERVIDAIQPGMPERKRREFALDYVVFLMRTKKAEQMGLDKGPNYEEQMKVARIQILSKALIKAIEEKVSQISDKDIENYYRDNAARFETAEVDRIYIPKTAHAPAAEQTMKEEADRLYARAIAGEEFSKLQAEAYLLAGFKSAVPNTSLKIRRVSLPPNQASVMDLKSGQISSFFSDPNGYVIYRLKTKDTLPLDQAREEIKATLRSQHMQDEMRSIQDSITSVLDESYFPQD